MDGIGPRERLFTINGFQLDKIEQFIKDCRNYDWGQGQIEDLLEELRLVRKLEINCPFEYMEKPKDDK